MNLVLIFMLIFFLILTILQYIKYKNNKINKNSFSSNFVVYLTSVILLIYSLIGINYLTPYINNFSLTIIGIIIAFIIDYPLKVLSNKL